MAVVVVAWLWWLDGDGRVGSGGCGSGDGVCDICGGVAKASPPRS